MEMKDKMAKLQQLKWLQNAPEAELLELARIATFQESSASTNLIAEDSESSEVFAVINGRIDVMIVVPGSPKPEIIATLGSGELFGELILLGRGRRSASARARDDVKLLVWKKNDLLNLFEKQRSIGYRLMHEIARVLAERLYSTNLALRNALSRTSISNL